MSITLNSDEVGWIVNGILDKLKCRFGCTAEVVGIYHIPEGCWCWNDPLQALCAQHAIKAESTGPIERLFYRTPDIFGPKNDQKIPVDFPVVPML